MVLRSITVNINLQHWEGNESNEREMKLSFGHFRMQTKQTCNIHYHFLHP